MEYNFDEIIPRRNTASLKWDRAKDKDILPMWVADMDFRAAQPIIDALAKRVAHGIFGYAEVPDAFYEATKSWFRRRYHFTIEKEWMLYTHGVVPALSAIIKGFTKPGDKVLVQTPVYNCFFSSIKNNNCKIAANELIYHNNTYSIDFEDLEKKAADPQVKLMILCNPHNPAGRVWTKEELTRIGEICIDNNVIIVSDEIHCDLTYKKYYHIPFASISEKFSQNSITCVSPSKSFNIAGVQAAVVFSENEEFRKKVTQAFIDNEIKEINVFGIEALIAAYNEGEEWLEQLKDYLEENYQVLNKFFKEKLPHIPVVPLEATYLVWIDCKALGVSTTELVRKLLHNEKLWVNASAMYGDKEERFIRINIACPRQFLNDGLNRMYDVLKM